MRKKERVQSVFHGSGNRQTGKRNSLQVENPKLARQWHPTRNAPLTPGDTTAGSDKKVWWICSKGHEWEAVIYNRSHGTGCPYCAGKRASSHNCLKTMKPEIAGQWHPRKNGTLTPKDVTAGSVKKIWWLCRKGHAWVDTIGHRSAGRGCPYCSGRRVSKENSLQAVKPHLVRQWHPTKNGTLTPRDVTAGSRKKVWWLCGKGHEWETCISYRGQGAGCPYCANRKAGKDNCLQVVKPHLGRQWHPTKNGTLTPKDVTPGSSRKVWWICGKKHAWEARIAGRTRGLGCPYCSGKKTDENNCLKTLNPKLAREWHSTKNLALTPKDVTLHSSKKVWWMCSKGHEWQSIIANRTKGLGCPFCAGQRATAETCLQKVNPGLAKQWHPVKNAPMTPKDVLPSSKRKVWWVCRKGHEWESVIHHRNIGVGCPYCSGRRATKESCLQATFPKLARQWHPAKNGALTPLDVNPGSGKKAWWLCAQGHEWAAVILSRKQGNGCPYCSGQRPKKENCLDSAGPWLAREWHPTKNASWTPRDVAPYSQRLVWWKCKKGHESRESVCSRYIRGGCLVCVLKRKTPRLVERDECRS